MAKVDRITDEFLFVENPESMPGPGLILHTRPPFLLGKVVNYKSNDEMHEHLMRMIENGKGKFQYGRCPGYNIIIIPAASLEEFEDMRGAEMHYRLFHMGQFYLNKKIMKNEGYYKRYKEKTG